MKKRYIPPSQIVSFPANASYNCVIWKAREIFFPDESNESNDCFCLTDSCGVPHNVESESDWVLSEFVQELKQPPSKLRISYVSGKGERVGEGVDKWWLTLAPNILSYPQYSVVRLSNFASTSIFKCTEVYSVTYFFIQTFCTIGDWDKHERSRKC